MHFEHCGAGDAILFIHGMPTSGRLWRGIIDRLQERYTCFTIDLPGLGKSPQEQYGPEENGREAVGNSECTARGSNKVRIEEE